MSRSPKSPQRHGSEASGANGSTASEATLSVAGQSKLAQWLAAHERPADGSASRAPSTARATAAASPADRPALPCEPREAAGMSDVAAPAVPAATGTTAEGLHGDVVFRVDIRRALKFAGYALLIVLQAAAIGYAVSAQQTEVFGARTEILFPLEADRATGFLREDRRISTQLESIRSRAVLGPVAARHGMTAERLREDTEVSVVGASEIIRIEVHHTDPELAQALSRDVTAQYLAQVEEDGVPVAEAVLGAALVELQGRLAEIDAALVGINESRRALPPIEASSIQLTSLAAEENRLLAESASLYSRIGEVRADITALDVERALAPQPVVLAETFLMDRPVSPMPIRDAALAAAMGGTVAAAVLTVLLLRGSAAPRARD